DPFRAAPKAEGKPEEKPTHVVIALKYIKASELAATIGKLMGKGPDFSFDAFPTTNSLVVRGSPADLEAVRALVEKLDVPAKDTAEPPAPELKTFTVRNVKATEAAKAVEAIYGKSCRVSSVGERSLIVHGPPTIINDVAKLLVDLEDAVERERAEKGLK